jgi:hypothetical protein
MKTDQLTLRLPAELSKALEGEAKERGVPRSQLVREALHAYLGATVQAGTGRTSWDRIAPYQGAVSLSPEDAEASQIARRIREHNWRE